MRSINKALILIIIVFTIVVSLISQEENNDVFFKFGIFKKDENKKTSTVEYDKVNKLHKNEFYKIYINPIKNAYVYLYLLDAKNNLFLIFPKNLDFFNKEYSLKKEFYIPEDKEDWFIFEEGIGTEKLFLLVSTERLARLENLTEKFLNHKSKGNTNRILTAKSDVINEIIRTNKANSDFLTYAEKPIPFMGTHRTVKNERFIIEVKAEKFYSKIIRFEH